MVGVVWVGVGMGCAGAVAPARVVRRAVGWVVRAPSGVLSRAVRAAGVEDRGGSGH